MIRTPAHRAHRIQAAQQLARTRRAIGAESFQAFARLYLPAHFRLPSSPMHDDLFRLLQQAVHDRGVRLAVAAPRSHAKSTIVSLAYLLWCICYAKERYIFLVSNTVDQASDQLSELKNELENNTLLQADFPEIAELADLPRRARAPRWRRDEIITRGPDGGVKVTVLGADKKLRGRKHRQHRPSLIVIDDLENESDVRSSDLRKNVVTWFTRALLKCGSSATNVIVIGTVMHYDALLTNLLDPRKSAGWRGRKYQAVQSWSERPDLWDHWERIFCRDEAFERETGEIAARAYFEKHRRAMLEGTDVLWPELEDYYTLMRQRLVEGRYAFDCEKQNEPVNPDECYFQESDFEYWDEEFASADALIRSIGDRGAWYCACDPSLGRAGRNADDTAIITMLKDPVSGIGYIVDADIRRRRPSNIVDDLIQYHQLRSFRRVAIETNQFQEFLADEVRRRSERCWPVPVYSINHTSDKLGRIQRLQPMITTGQVRFSKRQATLLDQLRQFPFAAHDDGPDALEMVVEASRYIEFPVGRVGGVPLD